MDQDNNLPQESLDNIKLSKDMSQVLHSMIEEQDPNKVKDLTHLFNMNIVKKNALRTSKLNELLDKIQESMSERFEKRPDEFSNKDLIDYMNAVSSAVEKTQKSVQSIDELPAITYNQQNNQVNINISDSLPRESREKITNAIQMIMDRIKNTQEPPVYENKEIKIEENIENGSN